MTEKDLVLVELKDGTVCRMAKKALNIFLNLGRVAKIKRADGWAVVGLDPMRDASRECINIEKERRAV